MSPSNSDGSCREEQAAPLPDPAEAAGAAAAPDDDRPAAAPADERAQATEATGTAASAGPALATDGLIVAQGRDRQGQRPTVDVKPAARGRTAGTADPAEAAIATVSETGRESAAGRR